MAKDNKSFFGFIRFNTHSYHCNVNQIVLASFHVTTKYEYKLRNKVWLLTFRFLQVLRNFGVDLE